MPHSMMLQLLPAAPTSPVDEPLAAADPAAEAAAEAAAEEAPAEDAAAEAAEAR